MSRVRLPNRSVVTGMDEMHNPGEVRREWRRIWRDSGAINVSSGFMLTDQSYNQDAWTFQVFFDSSYWTGR